MQEGNGRIQIRSRLYDYTVEFVSGVDSALLKAFGERSVYIVDAKVWRLYPDIFGGIPKERMYLVDAVEEKKNMDTVMDMIRFFQALPAGKDCKAICFGGGITQDVATTASCLYLRNIDWYFFPTTLLAMCDSCIGGKCGINLGEYKNQIGVFYPPKKIYIDTGFLHTLSENDYLNGWGELLKFSLTDDAGFFEEVSKETSYIPCSRIAHYIRRGLLIKKAVIEEDEFEADRRRVLNYGHTFGHALEAYTHHAIPHGMGVLWGMDVANFIAWKEGKLTGDDYASIKRLITSVFLKEEIRISEPDVLLEAVKRDKKVKGGVVWLAVPDGIGRLILHPVELGGRLYGLFHEYLEETHDYYMH